jgi:predicted nucleotidyltransferase
MLASHEYVKSAWGFGSFFRSASYSDIDVLVVVECERDVLLATSRTLRFAFGDVKAAMGVPIDLLILTSREFQERPLREMDELAPLYAAALSSTEGFRKV